MQDTLQAVELAVRRQPANPGQETFDVGFLFGGEGFAFPRADLIGLQNVVRGVVVRCVFEKAHQWIRPPGGHRVEMALQRLAEGAETTSEPAAIDGHDESHCCAFCRTRLVVGAGDVLLDRVIECPLVSRHLQHAVFDPAVGNRRGQQARLDIPPQQLARMP